MFFFFVTSQFWPPFLVLAEGTSCLKGTIPSETPLLRPKSRVVLSSFWINGSQVGKWPPKKKPKIDHTYVCSSSRYLILTVYRDLPICTNINWIELWITNSDQTFTTYIMPHILPRVASLSKILWQLKHTIKQAIYNKFIEMAWLELTLVRPPSAAMPHGKTGDFTKLSKARL